MSVEPHPFLAVGDRVRVKFGPLAGLEGFLIQKKNQTRFVLSMSLIMQAVSVEVDSADVEPLPLSGLSAARIAPLQLNWSRV
jgi:transcription antitermination factor NusG